MPGHGGVFGDLITGDGQVQWGGIVLGDGVDTFVDDDDGLTGWEDLPGIDSGNVPRPAQHGSWPGRMYAQERVVTWAGTLTPRGDMQAAVIAMRSATSVTPDGVEQPIVVRTLGETLVAWGQVTDRSLRTNRSYARGDARLVIQWVCADPRRYSLVEKHARAELPVSGGGTGLAYPLVYPLVYGPDPSVSSSLTAVNGLDADTPPLLVVPGPLEGPLITNMLTGVQLEFDIVLASTDVLTIDCREGTVLLNGAADRLYTRTAASAPVELFTIAPGTNPITLRALTWGAGNALDVYWRDATL